ncbi:TonB-dependent receptor [Thauera linaloolentis]|uniref:TonB-dependent receptor n=1 Tax=Thauera linaloolentis (strain DSM 12138 / JCM 21573 / CCUG 41526 / CIP 105981 / IAM 15112 / NBRC 102519 / 47Lol) TaxID=1123367 RepID=N6Z0U2_THAL4|nr:TonB-dependent receptor [Thauera linaloolentis]ENO85789.1 TonB-dependent receptor [Thauera linaloolentis 47Lol = DSM 12138]MCM8564483.1 TonB-dependent receptor [Thauera linaloolentis]
MSMPPRSVRAASLVPARPVALVLALAGAFGLWPLEYAHAANNTADDAPVTLGTVTVSARRAEEQPKDIPFSVSALSGEEAEARRLHTLEDVLRQTPGIDFVTNMGVANTTLRIRGVGALQKVSSDDTSVVINVDGMPMSAASATLNVLDVERVEVLKGPQGTLYGRNSEAGAVNIVTRKPTRWFEGQVRAEMGEDHHRLVEGVASGPLSDTVSARIALRSSGIDNHIENARDGKPLNEPREQNGRASLLWQIGAGTALNVSAGREEQKHRDWLYLLHPYGDPAQVDGPPGGESNRRAVNRYNAELTHDFGHSVLTLLSGYSRTHHDSTTPIYEGRTYTQLIGFAPDASWSSVAREKAWNHEVRLASAPEARVFWVVGLNSFRADRSLDRIDSYDTFYPDNPTASDTFRDFSTDADALFAEATWPLTDATKLTLGGRYTREKKTYKALWIASPDNSSPIREARDDQKLSDDYATGRIALGHALSPQLNVYGIYARGYKAGGFDDEGTNFNTAFQPDAPYKAAEVDSYEAGLKYESADRRLALNAALFFNQVRNDHLLMFDPQSMTTNKDNRDTESRGLDLDAQWRATQALTLSGGIAYTRAKIEGVGTAGDDSGVRSGNGVPEVPRWGATLSATYETALPPMAGLASPRLNAKLTNRYVGKRPADPQNTFDLKAYNKLDLRLGLQQGGTEVYLWADNLLDKQYDLYGYYIAPYLPGGSDARIGAPGRGRSLGVGLNVLF